MTRLKIWPDMQILRSKSKIKAVQFCPKKNKKELAQIALALSNNSIEVSVPTSLFDAVPIGMAFNETKEGTAKP